MCSAVVATSRIPLILTLFVAVLSNGLLWADYRIVVNENDPLVARAILRLPDGNGRPRTLTLRGIAWGRESQVTDVRGADGLLPNPSPGKWIVPSDCEEVRWKINFENATESPKSQYFEHNRWWLISETTSILRLDGYTTVLPLSLTSTPSQMKGVGAMPHGKGRWRIPAAESPPEFFVVGHAPATELNIRGFNITYIADDKKRVQDQGLQDAHGLALRYLLRLFPQSADVPEAERRLLVIWIGVGAEMHRIGGVAGSRSFIANYVYGPSATGPHRALGLSVIGHEQFHQLTALCFADASLPLWVNESLAQYYGLKALTSSGLNTQEILESRSRFIDAETPIEFGLLELSRRYKVGDRSVYPLFYSQGATFWSEVDAVVQQSSGGKRSLDDLLPSLLDSQFDETGALPVAFVSKLRAFDNSSVDRLVERYVGE